GAAVFCAPCGILSVTTTSVARVCVFFFFFQAEDGIRDRNVTGVQTCALPISQLAPQITALVSMINPAEGMKVRETQEFLPLNFRSEERRVGKECRSRWWPDH